MNEREKVASAAGLKDLQLLKLHPDDVPIAVVLADLRGRFGNHPAAFHPPLAGLPQKEYREAKAEMLQASKLLQRPVPSSFSGDARTLSPAAYAAERQTMLRGAR